VLSGREEDGFSMIGVNSVVGGPKLKDSKSIGGIEAEGLHGMGKTVLLGSSPGIAKVSK
jgi:hypothetical protein